MKALLKLFALLGLCSQVQAAVSQGHYVEKHTIHFAGSNSSQAICEGNYQGHFVLPQNCSDAQVADTVDINAVANSNGRFDVSIATTNNDFSNCVFSGLGSLDSQGNLLAIHELTPYDQQGPQTACEVLIQSLGPNVISVKVLTAAICSQLCEAGASLEIPSAQK